MGAVTAGPTKLELTRMPGPYGPIIRCRGALTHAGAEQFRQAVGILIPMRHPTLLFDLSELRQVDSTGLAALRALLDACVRERVRPILITGTGVAAGAVTVLGLDRQVIAVASEAEALDALTFLFGEVRRPSRTWNEAELETLHAWYRFRVELDQLPPEELARRLTGMFPVCERSEELIQLQGHPGEARCTLCPVFNATSRSPEHLGCNHILQPILEALARKDLSTARQGLEEMITHLEGLVGISPSTASAPVSDDAASTIPPPAEGAVCQPVASDA